jgi:hypothetical protein
VGYQVEADLLIATEEVRGKVPEEKRGERGAIAAAMSCAEVTRILTSRTSSRRAARRDASMGLDAAHTGETRRAYSQRHMRMERDAVESGGRG